jgi:CO/xanthine dehydrogenase Mo-binding subunit
MHHQVTPSPHTPGGFKGMGEAGTFPPGPALANAVTDALEPLGIEIDRMPISPNFVWSQIANRAGAPGPAGPAND